MSEPRAPQAPPLHREGFSRPETLFEKLGYAGSTWLGRAGVALVVLAGLFAVIVGVPAWSVAGSESYRAAKQFVYDSDAVHMEIGGEVVAFDKVPTRYRVEPLRGEFVFGVQGEVIRGIAAVTVEREGGVWQVTSASFVTDTRQPGTHRRVVLKPGR